MRGKEEKVERAIEEKENEKGRKGEKRDLKFFFISSRAGISICALVIFFSLKGMSTFYLLLI